MFEWLKKLMKKSAKKEFVYVPTHGGRSLGIRRYN